MFIRYGPKEKKVLTVTCLNWESSAFRLNPLNSVWKWNTQKKSLKCKRRSEQVLTTVRVWGGDDLKKKKAINGSLGLF